MASLRSSKQEQQLVAGVIGRWERLGGEMSRALLAGPPSDREVRRWVAEIGRLQIAPVMRLAAAEWSVERERGQPAPAARTVNAVYRRMLDSAFRDAVDLGALAIDGDDLRRNGIAPGPALGKILQALLAAVIDDPSRNTTDWLLQEARRLNTSLPPNGRVATEGGDGAGGKSNVRTPD
jgi:hypothetical protein